MRRKLADPGTQADRVRTAWWTLCVCGGGRIDMGRGSWLVINDEVVGLAGRDMSFLGCDISDNHRPGKPLQHLQQG